MDKVLMTRQFFRWCKQLFRVSFFGLYAAISLETNSSIAAPAAKLEDWRFYPEAFQLEINLSADTTPRYFYLAQPPRLVVDLPDTKLGYVPTQQNYSGAIQKIRVSQLNANVTRIVLDLAPGTVLEPNQVQLQPFSSSNTTRWVLRPFVAGDRTSSQQGNYPQPPANLSPSSYNYPQPPGNLPPSSYNYPQQPNNLPQTPYNYPQPPILTLPPPSSNLPLSSYNYPQTPLVTVPPLNYNNPTQQPGSVLPPATFPNQPGNFNSAPLSVSAPGFPVETVPNYPVNVPNSGVLPFGQPFPNSER